jgi:hypothetical protein
MARSMTETIWLNSDYGPALFEFVERKASRRKRLLISAEMLARLGDFKTVANRPSPRDLAATERLILQEADGELPSAFMVANQYARVDKYITAAVMGQGNLLTRLILEGAIDPGMDWRERGLRVSGQDVEGWRQFKFFADVVRDVIGNPFRSRSFQQRWRTSDTVGLARGIFDERAFDRMPILADALMDSGCDREDIISHCRSVGPHVRGCWVVDLILGKQ